MRPEYDTTARLLGVAFLFGIGLALAASLGCVGTPLPDPPSARPEAMTLGEVPPNAVRLAGGDGAIELGSAYPSGAPLRVSIPRAAARVEVPVSAAGAFSADVPGALTDTIYLEIVDASGDVFLGAVAGGGGRVVAAAAGADGDGDLSPDAIDCAPMDPMFASRECAGPCATDTDCAMGFLCTAGACVPIAEICGNGLDDDGDGLVDEDCGAACVLDSDCAAGMVCTRGFCTL